MNDPVLEALKGRFADGSRLIPGTRTVQSPAVDHEPEPDEVDEALRSAQEQLAQANGSGSPAAVAKARRAVDTATIAAIRSRHTKARTKGTNR